MFKALAEGLWTPALHSARGRIRNSLTQNQIAHTLTPLRRIRNAVEDPLQVRPACPVRQPNLQSQICVQSNSSRQIPTPFPAEISYGYSGALPCSGPCHTGFRYDRGAIGSAEPGIQPLASISIDWAFCENHSYAFAVHKTVVVRSKLIDTVYRFKERQTHRTPRWTILHEGFCFSRYRPSKHFQHRGLHPEFRDHACSGVRV